MGRYTALSWSASTLISRLPIIPDVNSFYHRPDLTSARGRASWLDALYQMQKLVNSAEGDEKERLSLFLSDCLIACGQFGEALDAMPRPTLRQRWSAHSSTVLAIKLVTGAPVAATDVIGLFGPTFTKLGRENVEAVAQYLEVHLEAAQRETSLIDAWAADAHEVEVGLPLFAGNDASYRNRGGSGSSYG